MTWTDRADGVLGAGTQIAGFRILGFLGEGAMGQVYLAQDITLGRRVALKLIKRSVLELGGAARFLEEARATASLNHPHIVTIHAFGEHEGRPYLALEHIDGESLRARLAAGPLSLRETLRCCRAVADAIAAAHRNGLVHADLKPENIVLSSDDRVRVVDFGLARFIGMAPQAASGTPAYMAPERWRGHPPTEAIDIWALGIMLHELILGARPIRDIDLPGLAFRNGPLELPALPDASWAQLVRDCLAREPAARPSAEEVERRLSALLAAVSAHPPTPIPVLVPAPAEDSSHVVGSLAARMPYMATELAASEGRLRIVLTARATGSPADAWLAPVVEHMARRSLRDQRTHRLAIVEDGGDAMRVELEISRGEQLRIDAVELASGQLLASASASSVVSAVRALVDELLARLGAGSERTDPDPDERAAMARLGATSVATFRRYIDVLYKLHATSLPDLHELAAAARRIIAEDPVWAHPYALLALIEGQVTAAARDALAAGRAAIDTVRDPSGAQLLAALELASAGEVAAAADLAGELHWQSDLYAGQVLASWCLIARRAEEGVAMLRHLHAGFPELSFGVDLAQVLRREGRAAEAERVIREWVAAAPDNLPARVELVRIEANAWRIDEARARAREVLAIHAGPGDALPDLFDALVASDQLPEARAIADRMLAGSQLDRARGRYRVAMSAVLEGRFAAAYDVVRRAIAEHRTFGMQSELTQCLELARSIAPLVSDIEAQRRYTVELAATFAGLVGDVGTAAALRFERALLTPAGVAPSVDAHLADLEDGSVREVARRRMLRAAAVAGCGTPEAAVSAGFAAFEENTASLLALGQCAARTGELDLARRSLERATQHWSGFNNNQSSPYHAVLARFYLARVLADLGEAAAARAACEAFLRCWSAPDRPIPEVAIAQRMLRGKA